MRVVLFSLFLFSLSLFSCKKPDPGFKEGVLEISIRPTVSGQSFETENTYESILGRKYMIDRLLIYLSDIYVIKENGEEQLLSEIALLDFVEGGAAKRVAHGPGAFVAFRLEEGEYDGVKFGIGVPDRLNTQPSQHDPSGSLSDIHGTFLSSKQGYAYITLEGRTDSSPEANGQNIDQAISYRIGKDSLNSPNNLYRTLTYSDSQHAFRIEEGRELQFIIEMDINRMFYNASDTLNMFVFPKSESSAGEDFLRGKNILDKLVNGALFKVPF